MEIKMGIIDVRISIPEAVDAISKFKENRFKALEEVSAEVKKSLSKTLNDLLKTEMTIFLGRAEESGNKRNGFKEKDYTLKGVGTIRIKVPKDRNSKFESSIIPSNEVIDPRLKEDMAILHLAGISTRVMAMISKRLLGLDVSAKTVSNSLSLVEERAKGWLQRPLSKRYWALYVDGTYFKIQRRGSVEAEPSLVVLGVDHENKRSILAIEPGFKDSAVAWKSVFNSLIERGLNIEDVQLGIMDGLPGLERVFKETFLNAKTQRCWVHSLANSVNKAPKRLHVPFKKLAHAVMYAESREKALEAFSELKYAMGSDAKRAVNTIEKDLDSLLTFFDFPQELWNPLRTSNAIERVNKEFKRRTKSMGTIGEKNLEILVAFIALRLEQGWQKNPINAAQFKHLTNVRNPVESSFEILLESKKKHSEILNLV
jgi:putative transposase